MAQAILSRLRNWNPQEEERRRLRRYGYICYFVFFCILFTWLYLPSDAIVASVTTKVSGFIGRPVEAQSVGLAGLSGVRFRNLSVSTAPGQWINLDEQTIKVGILSTLSGEPRISSRTVIGEGRADLNFAAGSEEILLDIEADNLPLGPLFPEERDDRIWIRGVTSGKASLKTPGVEQTTGPQIRQRLLDLVGAQLNADIRLQSGKIGGIVAGGYPIPAFSYDQGHLVVTSSQNKLKVETLEIRGPDIDVEISGTIDLVTPFERSRPNLRLRLTTHGAFKTSFDALLGTQLKRESDGGLSGFIQGTMAQPQIRK